jgi:ATP synthase protein I
MTDPEKDSGKALTRLGERLDAVDALRVRQVKPVGEAAGVGEGYRLLGTLIGGVLGGLGLGWFVDRLAHTGPFCMIGGLLIGTAASIYTVVRSTMTSGGAKPVAAPSKAVDDGNDLGG